MGEEALNAGRPIRVAVLGGGCASIAAAFELTRREHRGRYQVTVYQQGWRLGGKGASGRGPAGRIEEHGLHVWMGFYENAFRLLRECYGELGRDRSCPISTWREAFITSPYIGIAEQERDGTWQDWTAMFTPMPGLPGDPMGEENPFTISGYLAHALRLVLDLFESVQNRHGTGGEAVRGETWSRLSPEAVLEQLARLVKYGYLASLVGIREGIRGLAALLQVWSRVPPRRGAEDELLRPLEAVSRNALRQLEGLALGDGEARRLWVVADLLLTVVRGTLRFGIVTDPRGFDAIDDYDFKEWLELNGASRATLDSAFVRMAYDMMFAYEDGDPERPRVSAGAMLRGNLRMLFTYRGSFFWKMRAGMGDIVFAPFYEVLERRGVRFEFFHRLENVKVAGPLRPGERPFVEALELDVQARVQGAGGYRPLVDVGGLPCWPSLPDWDQLEEGERLRREGWDFESFWDRRRVDTRTLRVVEDFDFVVLGIGIGAVPHVCSEIVARDPRWRRMTERVKTIETAAFQLWMSADLPALGWPGPEGMTLTSFAKPFDTWADMSHLIPSEAWPAGREPRSISYFCCAFPSGPQAPDRSAGNYHDRRQEDVRRAAARFLDREARHLWPKARNREGGFRWELLVDPEGAAGSGSSRFGSQFWRANVNPSDRYTLSLPGTAGDRISPLDNTYDNLTIAGDWTACGITVGCVEAAVMSGRLAAHALSGSPVLEEIVGFDHP